MDLMSNKRKKRPTSRGKGKGRGRGKAKAKRTSRGLVSPYLPFRAHTYGKGLPEWAKSLGWTSDTIPVVTMPSTPKTGFYSVSFTGAPGNKPKGKAKPKVSKLVRLEGQLNRAVAALTKALTSGAKAEAITKLEADLKRLQQLVVAERVFEAKVAAAIRGATPAQIRKEVRAEIKREANKVGLTPKEAASSPIIQVAAGAPVTSADRQRVIESIDVSGMKGFGDPEFGKILKGAERAQAFRLEFPELAANPDVYGYAKGGKKRILLDMQPSDRKTPGAVTVVVGPQAYRYATLAVKELKKNGLYSVRKNMSKKRRRMHKNPLGSDLMALGRPVLGATAGFAASRAVNALALHGLRTMEKDGKATSPTMKNVARIAATGAGIAATLTLGNRVGLVRENRQSIVAGMALNLIEALVRGKAQEIFDETRDTKENLYLRDLALGASYYDVSHAGAPYAPMMGEYVSQSLNGGMGSYIAQAAAGMGEYVSQSLNGGDGLGEYVSQSLNGLGEYAEGVDPSDQEGVDGMISHAESVAGLGTEVMAATAGLGATEVMAATAGLGNVQGMNRGIVTRRGVYNFFTQPVSASGGRIPAVSIEDAPMPVVGMGLARPGAVPIGDQVATPEGRGYAGGIFARNVFGSMV